MITVGQMLSYKMLKMTLEVKRDQAKRDQPKGTSQKGPAKRDHGQKGPSPNGNKYQKGPRPKRDQMMFSILIYVKCKLIV